MPVCTCINLLFALFVAAVSASAQRKFLGIQDQHLGGNHHGVRSIGDLLAELEQAVGRETRDVTERRVERLEEALRPMAAAMPHDGSGLLDSTSVRYLLHRLFVQRHGWFVKGLDNSGGSWNSSSPAQVFKDHADEVHTLFETKLNNTGFSLHQVAVFAATLEALVHSDNIERLKVTTELLGFSGEQLDESQVRKLMKAYMAMFVVSVDLDDVADMDLDETLERVARYYPAWPDTEIFVHEVRESVLADVVGEDRASWSSTLRVLEEVGERYGRWQDAECRVMKHTLQELEDGSSGRVPLDRFYGGSLSDPSWQFMESVPYLRQLGALDEADPQRLRVIIPNYVNSRANCLASSKFYSVCCINECESLLGTLEEKIAAPDASPARIIELVSELPSDTVKAPQVLSASMQQRLEDIAAHHAGLVPLHGRLFAQWLHHVYPRECPYPHLSGVTKPVSARDYIDMEGVDYSVKEHEVVAILNSGNYSAPAVVEVLPWSPEEELFVCRPGSGATEKVASRSFVRNVMSIVLMTAMLVALKRLFGRATLSTDADCQKHFV